MATHEERPQRGDGHHEDVRRAIEAIPKSSYYSHVLELKPLIHGKIVIATAAGSSGFQLTFGDGTWVLCFLLGCAMDWRVGQGPLSAIELSLLNSPLSGDARPPQVATFVYAEQACDIAAEVAQSVQKKVEGVAIGANCFSVCFPDGMELDGSVRKDASGRDSLRVFWEQW